MVSHNVETFEATCLGYTLKGVWNGNAWSDGAITSPLPDGLREILEALWRVRNYRAVVRKARDARRKGKPNRAARIMSGVIRPTHEQIELIVKAGYTRLGADRESLRNRWTSWRESRRYGLAIVPVDDLRASVASTGNRLFVLEQRRDYIVVEGDVRRQGVSHAEVIRVSDADIERRSRPIGEHDAVWAQAMCEQYGVRL